MSPRQYREFSSFIKDHFYGWHSRYFAEYGEDSIVNCLLSYRREGFYVDVGAFHPKRLSSTYFFYKKQNWRGIIVEPNTVNAELFKIMLKRDIVVNRVVASKASEMKYFMFEYASQNTFDEQFKNDRIAEGMKVVDEAHIKVQPLEELLDESLPQDQVIDYLNIDVEGFDLDVLKSNNWKKYRPTIITIEDIKFDINNSNKSEIYTYLKAQGYKLDDFSYIILIIKRTND